MDWMKSVRQMTTITEGVLMSCSPRPSVIHLWLTSWTFCFRGDRGTLNLGEPCPHKSEELKKSKIRLAIG